MKKGPKTLKGLIEKNPEEAARILLDTPTWLQGVEAGERYFRFEDDTRQGGITVVFGPHDGDAWVDIYQERDSMEPHSTPRFRTYFGGGQSLRVRQALMILALAIKLENEENPQDRGQ